MFMENALGSFVDRHLFLATPSWPYRGNTWMQKNDIQIKKFEIHVHHKPLPIYKIAFPFLPVFVSLYRLIFAVFLRECFSVCIVCVYKCQSVLGYLYFFICVCLSIVTCIHLFICSCFFVCLCLVAFICLPPFVCLCLFVAKLSSSCSSK